MRTETVKCPVHAVITKSRARHVHVMSLNLLTSRKTPLIKSRTTDGSLRFRSSFRKPKRFHLLSICANAFYNVLQLLKDISSIRFFCKDIHKTLKYVDKFSELKMTKVKKELTHLSLSLYLSICRCTLIFLKGCACTSLTLFLYLHLQKRFGSRSDLNGIQERMFCQFVIESKQCVVQTPMRTIKWVFSISQEVYTLYGPMRGSRGGQGVRTPPPPPPLKNHLNI